MKPNSGLSLVSIIVSFGILGLAIVGSTQLMQTINQRKTAAEWLGAKSTLKRLLLSGTACDLIKKCVREEYIEIRSLEGSVLMKSDRSSQYGPFNAAARCLRNRSIEFRIAAPKPGGGFAKDPLNGKVLDWNSPEGVLIRGGDLCGVPQFGSERNAVGAPRVVVGKLCKAKNGTCPSPPGSQHEGIIGPTMCCTDGRDAEKPNCPSGTYEIASYWDRDNDWGIDGRWMVSCQ